jgi:tRNA wybutosine-synthesizing protein 3
MKFAALKQKMLAKLESEGCDGPVKQYLDLVNSAEGVVTSSSCYGRILVIDMADKKHETRFVGKWHRRAVADEVWAAIEGGSGNIWFKFEPLILHVSCDSVETARKFLQAKAAAGIKRGGIFAVAPERVQIELEGTSRIQAPVKNGGELLVTREYVEKLVESANKKFEKNEQKWQRFADAFTLAFQPARAPPAAKAAIPRRAASPA